jgi:nucleoside-diphosphate-sugar epimerase
VWNRLTIFEGDLNEQETVNYILSRCRPDVVINCAFQKGYPSDEVNQRAMLITGVQGTANLLFASNQVGVEKFIQLGSSTEYGNRNEPCREDDPIDPVSFRGMVKAASTLFCRQFAQEHHFPVIILRLFSVYGFWEPPERLIPSACMAALRNTSISLTPPRYSHDYIFSRDVDSACLKALHSEVVPGEIINIGSGRITMNEEVIELIEKISGASIERSSGTYPLKPIDHPIWLADISKAAKVLEWKPSYSFEAGLQETWNWWQNHPQML